MTIDYLPWNRPVALADRVCIRDANAELTYAEVARRVDAVAGQFAAAGVGRGDVVAVMLPNRVELLLGLMAAWRLGAAATPVNPVFTANEAGYQIDSGAKLLLAADPGADYGVPVLAVDELNASPFGSLPVPDTRLDDLALLIYTSGTTGRPKGVMLDHANLLAMAASIVEAIKLSADDHCLLVLPLFHVNAILVSCLAPIMAGGQATILPRFAPDTFFAAVVAVPGDVLLGRAGHLRAAGRAARADSSATPRPCGSRCAARPRCPGSCCSGARPGSASRSSRGTG